jgi:nicotinamidase-related amidase
MAFDFKEFVAPAHTAVITCEMEQGIIGDIAPGRELADEVKELGVLEAAVALVRDARAAGVRVIHATVAMRADRAGISVNNPMMAYVVKNPNQILQGTPAAAIVPELGPEPEDIVLERIHGLTPFNGTELDPVMRNLGIRTIVPVGVSLNEALMGLCICAADLGYQIALPTDAVAGVPRSYAQATLANTYAYIANLTTTEKVRAAWK